MKRSRRPVGGPHVRTLQPSAMSRNVEPDYDRRVTDESRTTLAWPTHGQPLPCPPLPEALRFVADVDQRLHAPELAALSARIGESGLWSDYVVVSEESRDYRLLFENDFVEIWVCSWLSGQTARLHDHDLSEVGIAVVEGAIKERHLQPGRADPGHVLRTGQQQEGPLGYIHQVEHFAGAPAVTIHSYSPPLVWLGLYSEADGQMRRLRAPGRNAIPQAGPVPQ